MSETKLKSSSFIILLHLIALIHFSYGVFYDFQHVNVPQEILKSKRTDFGGKFKYLTFINAVNFSHFCEKK